jgi:putative phage-type endonuclease
MTTDKKKAVGQHIDEAEWLEERKKGLTATQVPAILGVHPYMDERDVYFEKVGVSDGQEVTPYMERGRVLEEPAAQLYSRETGREIRRIGLLRHKELPILMASMDRQILASPENPTAGLEIKVPAWRTYAKVRQEGILPHWIIQAQVQQMCSGYPFVAFGILNADQWKMITHDFEPIPELGERILEKVSEWWERHIVAGTPPEPKIEPAIELPTVGTSEIITREDPEWIHAADLFREAKGILEQAKELDKAARDSLRRLMLEGGQEVVEGAGLRVYCRTKDGRLSFQKKDLAAARPIDRTTLIEGLVQDHKWAPSEAEALADLAMLDVSSFEKRGNAYQELRPYVLKDDA